MCRYDRGAIGVTLSLHTFTHNVQADLNNFQDAARLSSVLYKYRQFQTNNNCIFEWREVNALAVPIPFSSRLPRSNTYFFMYTRMQNNNCALQKQLLNRNSVQATLNNDKITFSKNDFIKSLVFTQYSFERITKTVSIILYKCKRQNDIHTPNDYTFFETNE